jgi:proline iminopeptidase
MKMGRFALACVALIAVAVPPLRAADSNAVTQGYVQTADGVSLFFRRVGSGKELTVYLHGGPGSNFRGNGTLMDPLAGDGRSLVMYDQRGSGLSTLISDPARLTVDDHVRDLEAVRQHFGAGRMSLIGLSWGSGLAALYATKHPGRVTRLLLVSPMSPAKEFDTVRMQALHAASGEAEVQRRASVVQEIATADDDATRLLCREYSDLVFRAYLTRPTTEALGRASERCDIPAPAIRNRFVVANVTFKSLGDYDFRPMLQRLRMPALVLEGAETNVPLEATREWTRNLPASRLLLLPRAGHELFLDEPDAFLRAAREFLNGNFPGGAVRVSKRK